jgi:hypothetical protein
MPKIRNSSMIPPVVYDDKGKKKVLTEKGYKYPEDLGFTLDETEGSDVTIANIEPGDDLAQNWKRTVNAAIQRVNVSPLPTPAGPMPNCFVPLGTAGKAGDLIGAITPIIRTAGNARIILHHGTASDLIGGVSGTALAAPSNAPSVVANVAFTATANQHEGCIFYCTYIPTVGGVSAGKPIRFESRIDSHPAYAASGTAFSPVLVDTLPQGATITAWGVRPVDSAWEIARADQTGGRIELFYQATASGGWRISVFGGVAVTLNGQFTW